MHMLWGYKVQMNIPFHVLMARITNFSSKPLGKDEAFTWIYNNLPLGVTWT